MLTYEQLTSKEEINRRFPRKDFTRFNLRNNIARSVFSYEVEQWEAFMASLVAKWTPLTQQVHNAWCEAGVMHTWNLMVMLGRITNPQHAEEFIGLNDLLGREVPNRLTERPVYSQRLYDMLLKRPGTPGWVMQSGIGPTLFRGDSFNYEEYIRAAERYIREGIADVRKSQLLRDEIAATNKAKGLTGEIRDKMAEAIYADGQPAPDPKQPEKPTEPEGDYVRMYGEDRKYFFVERARIYAFGVSCEKQVDGGPAFYSWYKLTPMGLASYVRNTYNDLWGRIVGYGAPPRAVIGGEPTFNPHYKKPEPEKLAKFIGLNGWPLVVKAMEICVISSEKLPEGFYNTYFKGSPRDRNAPTTVLRFKDGTQAYIRNGLASAVKILTDSKK